MPQNAMVRRSTRRVMTSVALVVAAGACAGDEADRPAPALRPTTTPTTACTVAAGAACSGADLGFTSFEGEDLHGIDLSGAFLDGANFAGADLSGADLSDAHVNNTDLTGADLSGADLSNAVLAFSPLSGADLTGADLTGATIEGASLIGADLTGADITGADLTGADLTDAVLTGVDLAAASQLTNAAGLTPEVLVGLLGVPVADVGFELVRLGIQLGDFGSLDASDAFTGMCSAGPPPPGAGTEPGGRFHPITVGIEGPLTVPQEWLAPGLNYIEGVLCVEERSDEVGLCPEYAPDVHLMQQVVQVRLVRVPSGEIAVDQTHSGDVPVCPSSSESPEFVFGSNPHPNQALAALAAFVGEAPTPTR